MNIWAAALYGVIAGILGTATGGLLACFVPARNKRVVSFILEYSGGLMLAVVCFDLLPNAFQYASFPAVMAGIVGGAALMLISEAVISAGRKYTAGRVGTARSLRGAIPGIRSTGMIIALGVAIHNFPEGLAVGSGFEAELSLGLSLAIAIMLHDVPEGISISVPLLAGGSSRLRAFLLTLASGLPMGLGALIGAAAGKLSAFFIAICLAVSGGAMLYVVFADMIPESKRMYAGRFGSFGSFLGVLSGILISVQLNVH